MTDHAEQGHNIKATDERLRLLIERWERLEEEKQGVASDQRDVMAEAKAVGYDPRIIRDVIKIRKMDPNDRSEREILVDTYLCAIGMG